MQKVKIAFWLILLGVVGLVVYQNKDFFSLKHSLMLNPFVTSPCHSPDLPNGVWFFACFAIGVLLAYFFSLMERFRSNRTIKELKAKTDSLLDMISQLRKELESRRSSDPGDAVGLVPPTSSAVPIETQEVSPASVE